MTQVLLAQLPLLMHPDPKNVYVLGLGAGVTAGSSLTHRSVRRVDCAEIHHAVGRAARQFADVNGDPEKDPRFSLVIDDGRHMLEIGDRTYDVMIVEPSNPWMAGITSIFTVEFLKLVRSRLAPGGLALQWTHAYEIDESSLVGATDPKALDGREVAKRMAARMADPKIAAELARVKIHGPAALLANEVFDSKTLAAWTGPDPVLADDLPILEFTAPPAYYEGRMVLLPDDHLPLQDGLLVRFLDGRGLTSAERVDLARMRMEAGNTRGLAAILTNPPPDDPRLAAIAGKVLLDQSRADEAVPLLEAARRADEKDPAILDHLIEAELKRARLESPLLVPRRFTRVRQLLSDRIRLDPGRAETRLRAAEIAASGRDPDAALAYLQEGQALFREAPGLKDRAYDAWWSLALTFTERGLIPRALQALQGAAEMDPENPNPPSLAADLARLRGR
jgi:spermidine synthase